MQEWWPEEQEYLNQYLNWKADLHSCGLHLSETVNKDPKAFAAIAADYCAACAALERDQGKQSEKDEKDRKAKKPVYAQSRLWQVMPREEAAEAARAYAKRMSGTTT